MEAGRRMSPFQPQSFDETTLITPELAEAVRITNRRLVEHVSPDLCQRCGGLGCDQCLHCDCRSCSRIQPATQAAVRRWRP